MARSASVALPVWVKRVYRAEPRFISRPGRMMSPAAVAATASRAAATAS